MYDIVPGKAPSKLGEYITLDPYKSTLINTWLKNEIDAFSLKEEAKLIKIMETFLNEYEDLDNSIKIDDLREDYGLSFYLTKEDGYFNVKVSARDVYILNDPPGYVPFTEKDLEAMVNLFVETCTHY